MQAIVRLEKAGFTDAEICAAAGINAPAMRRWKRGETTPSSAARDRLVKFAETRGVVLLGSDFSRQPISSEAA